MGSTDRAALAQPLADPAGTDAVIAGVLQGLPDVDRALDEVRQAAWQATDPRLLELCRLRIAQLLDCAAEAEVRTPGLDLDEATIAELADWPRSERFDDADRAVLALCEQWIIDVASLDDATTRAVADALGDDGLVDLVGALIVVEQRQRLRLTWDRLGLSATALGTQAPAASVTHPPPERR